MTLLPFTGDLVRAFGWTILHSAWQALFVYACLRVVLAIWPMASAKIKYNLATVSLMSIFTWFIITLLQQLHAIESAREAMEAAAAHLQLAPNFADQPVETIYKSQDQLKWVIPGVENWFPVLVALYAVGFCVMTIKLISDLAQLQQIRTHKTESIDPAWEARLQQLAATLRIPRKVQLLVSGYIQVPVMLGCFKPLILLPVAMVNNLTPEQLEAILLHELAHIKRNDYLLNIFQSIVETILFFNPFVWLISRIIRQEREHCCDDLVIGKVQPLHYAHALVALEEYRLSSNSLAMAAADNKQHLFNRIKRIMEMKTKNLNYSQRLLAVLIIATGIISIAWLNPAKVKASEKNSAEKIKTVKEQVVTTNNSRQVISHKILIDTAAVILQTDTTMPAPPPPPPAPAEPTDLPPAPPAAPAMPPLPPAPPMPPQHAIKNGHVITFNELSPEDQANVNKQIAEAKASVDRAMKQLKEVDMKQVMAQAQTAVNKVDWKKVEEDLVQSRREIKIAMENLNKDVINKNINVNIDSLNKVVQTQLRETRNYVRQYVDTAARAAERGMREAERGREQADRARAQADRAREQADRAREQADRTRASNDNRFHQLIAKLTADKLIDAKTGYSIIKKGDVLTINGEKQPAAVFQKYQPLMKEKNLTINGTTTSLNIDAQD
ncbi:M56 family metallopeptidase [Chitinophaga sp. Cy-1792]|uniref:M56 family metallopeptidase n=1 Tax=Chitinophaga sp. Cy-1792 TaxID=2608339 RepID=UPI00141FA12E|nr:M56 family metallopeptidase [Chitinophaga sp. Cy-1792]NIG57723.1 M56 family metallopeptidase [Chitinophaga sp. Cy-1792]